MSASHPDLLWIVILSGITCAILAMAIGANDVANAFSTSVGSGALKLSGAVTIAFIFEVIGSIILGGAVTDAIRKKVLNFAAFQDAPSDLALGMFCASAGAAVWLIIATNFGMPISTTHSIVGALAGFGVASGRVDSVRWLWMLYILLSWFLVPLTAVIVSATMYIALQELILKRRNPHIIMRYFYWLLITITSLPLAIFIAFENPFMKSNTKEGILYDYKNWFNVSSSNRFLVVVIILSALVLILSAVTYQISSYRIRTRWSFLDRGGAGKVDHETCPDDLPESIKGLSFSSEKTPKSMELHIEGNKIEVVDISGCRNQSKSGKECPLSGAVSIGGCKDGNMNALPLESVKYSKNHETETIFSALQIVGAITVIISHSANDTANAVAPFATVLLLHIEGIKGARLDTPWYILLCGGLCMAFGLTIFGYKVIQTVGLNITRVTPSRGYTIDTTAGCLVLVLSQLGIPLSSTHCAVSSILGVGMVDYLKNEDYIPENIIDTPGENKVSVINLSAEDKTNTRSSVLTSILRKFPPFSRITTKRVNLQLYKKIFVTWISTIFFSGTMSGMLFVVVRFCTNLVKG